MKLPLSEEKVATLFHLLEQLDRLGFRCVLVGGLVPPLLLAALDPDGVDEDRRTRRTADCDIALDLAVADGALRNEAVEALLVSLDWERQRRANQFRWAHGCGLWLDLLPVPVGIEAGDEAAVAFARRKLEVVDDPSRFYRGYELALAEPIEIQIASEGTADRRLLIAGLTAFLAMKLEAWTDSYMDRRRDAYDVAWLLRHAPTATVVDALRRGQLVRSDLVEEIVERLRRHFCDPWDRGVRAYATEAFGMRDEDLTEPDRNAAAGAIRRVIETFGPSRL